MITRWAEIDEDEEVSVSAHLDEEALLRGMLEIESPSGGERPLAEYLARERGWTFTHIE